MPGVVVEHVFTTTLFLPAFPQDISSCSAVLSRAKNFFPPTCRTALFFSSARFTIAAMHDAIAIPDDLKACQQALVEMHKQLIATHTHLEAMHRTLDESVSAHQIGDNPIHLIPLE